jgi:hypothetical protein
MKLKGNFYYEIQILMFVIMWKHDLSHKPSGEQKALVNWGRLYIWKDSAWRFHGLPGRIRFFFHSLTKNADKFNRPQAKLRVIWINARHMFRHWALEVPIVDSMLSLLNYIALHRAGFRITCSTSDDMSTALYRFWWGTKMIEDMADIDRVNDGWGTMLKGRARQLGDHDNVKSYTAAEITEMAETWKNFNGFTGESCCQCRRTVNVFAYGSGWMCNCGTFNAQSWSNANIPHENPDLGPSRAVINLGLERSPKHQMLIQMLTAKPHPFFKKDFERNLEEGDLD